MWLIKSSVGRKVVMSVTGLFLILFLTFHALMNAVAVYSLDAYEAVCEFLGANWYAHHLRFLAHVAEPQRARQQQLCCHQASKERGVGITEHARAWHHCIVLPCVAPLSVLG